DNIYSERACTVDVIKNTYRGLKIPSAAIRDGGQAGSVVDVRTAGGIIQKSVKVIYTASDGTAIVKAGTEDGDLLLYDEVVIRSNRK
ncbi:MAG: hypothetical protein Q8873_07080, partial [Bacillota bacterium]|nr:hypothetical protein [Bacillota bacterium]